MQDHLMDLYNQEISTGADAEDDEPAVTSEGLTCEDHDLGKERATVLNMSPSSARISQSTSKAWHVLVWKSRRNRGRPMHMCRRLT